MENKRRKLILKKIKDAHKKKVEAPGELADAIREANNAGITYREIGELIGMSKSGVSEILARSK